jgi:hypothetical protein
MSDDATSGKMTDVEAVAALDALTATKPGTDHAIADEILLACVPESVRVAYEALVARSRWWATE